MVALVQEQVVVVSLPENHALQRDHLLVWGDQLLLLIRREENGRTFLVLVVSALHVGVLLQLRNYLLLL